MTQQPKLPPFPNMPYRYPFSYPPPIAQKMKVPQPGLSSNTPPNPTLNPNIPGAPFMPPRMFNPYFGGYNMFPMPHFPPYMPLLRPPQFPPTTPQNSKNQKQSEQSNLPPQSYFNRPNPFYNPRLCYPPPQYTPTDQQIAKIQSKSQVLANTPKQKEEIVIQNDQVIQNTQKPQKILKNQKTEKSLMSSIIQNSLKTKEVKPHQSSSSHTPINKQQFKNKLKQVRHADIKKYEPQLPKKKKKKQVAYSQHSSLRQTREKKQSIEKLMLMVMKSKPPRDRVIKIGRQYQAVIPQSFINECQYNLKIKLLKKKSLMSRLINKQAQVN